MTQSDQRNSGRPRGLPPEELSHDQYLRSRELVKAGVKRRDAEALVSQWDRLPLERRLEMFELAGNEEEAALVREQLERERR